MFGEKLKGLRKENHISQQALGEMLGVGQSTVAMWEKGKNSPEHKNLLKLSEIFSVSIDHLTGSLCEKTIFQIPVLGYVRAGNPTEAFEEELEKIDVVLPFGAAESYFALKIKGDSMSPRMMEGDTVIVKKQSDCENGDICVAMVGTSDATVKKIIKKENGIILMPLNPTYDPLFFTPDEVEKAPVSILGKVTELRARI